MQWANLEEGLDSTLNVVWNELKHKAEVIKEYGRIPEVECIASQLNQVFMNLLVNAVQAIPDRGQAYRKCLPKPSARSPDRAIGQALPSIDQ